MVVRHRDKFSDNSVDICDRYIFDRFCMFFMLASSSVDTCKE